jgi:hypothetical protein
VPEAAWLAPALELAADPQATLSEFVVSAGLGAFSDLIKEEVEHLAGSRGKKRPERTASRWGHRKARLPLGGRTVTLDVQRVRGQDGGEVTLTSVARFQSRDVLAERVIKQILSNVSTRGYEGTLQAAPGGVKTAGASKSAVTRRFVAGSGPGAAEGGDEALLAGVVLRKRPAHGGDTDGRSRWRFHLHWGDVSTSGAQDGARSTGSRRTVLRVEGAWRRRLTREKIGNERGCFGKPYKRTGTVFKSQPDLSLHLVRLRWQPRCGARGREEVR